MVADEEYTVTGRNENRHELKLGVSYEGWKKRYPRRKEIFYGGEFDSEKFWGQTTMQTLEDQELNEDTRFLLNGYGASWI